jgi:hypothetical protein
MAIVDESAGKFERPTTGQFELVSFQSGDYAFRG